MDTTNEGLQCNRCMEWTPWDQRELINSAGVCLDRTACFARVREQERREKQLAHIAAVCTGEISPVFSIDKGLDSEPCSECGMINCRRCGRN